MTVHIYVVTFAEVVEAGVVVQLVIPAVPLIVQVTAPVGALAPAVPVTVVVNVSVELSAPLPLPIKATPGATLLITTVNGVVDANAV